MALAKAFLRPETGGDIPCLINPTELTVAKSVSWQAGEAKGGNAPKLRFQGGQSGTLTLTLMLDTTHDGSDVTEHTNKLLDLMKVDSSLPGADSQRSSARPPWVEFHWGKMHSFKAVLERVSLRFTYFASSGMPLRAKADLTLNQFEDEDVRPLQNPTSHTATLHSVHVAGVGDTLDRLAARYYLDPTRWRLIAEANGVVDPFDLPVGAMLRIPEPGVRRRA
jgi:nucleoid-associated protein YgaU